MPTNGQATGPVQYAIIPIYEGQRPPANCIEHGSFNVIKDRIDGVTRSKANSLIKQAVKAKAALSRVDSLQQSLGHYAELFQEMEQRVFALEALVRAMNEHKQKLDANETERLVAERIRAALDSLPDEDGELPVAKTAHTPAPQHENTGDLSPLPGHVSAEPDDDEGSLTPGFPPTSGSYPLSNSSQLSRAPKQPQFRTPAGVSLGEDGDY